MSDDGQKPEWQKPEMPSDEEYRRLEEQAGKLRAASSEKKPQHKRFGVDKGVNAWLKYTTAGLQFVLMLLLPMGLGYWLDTKFDLLPWLTLTGFVLGAVGGMTSLIREVMRMGAKDDAKRVADKADKASHEDKQH